MDYLYAGAANERIVQGNLPQSPLHKVSPITSECFDLYEKGKDILVYLKRNPEALHGAISSSLNYVFTARHLLQPNIFEAPFNLVINTTYNPAVLSDETPAYNEAIHLCPVVTDMDKALWLIIASQAMLINTVDGEEKEHLVEMFFAWVYLLKIVQENEYIFGKTLDFSSVSETGLVLEILWSPWSERNTYAHFVDLTPTELDAIKQLEYTRKALKDQIALFISHATTIATETDYEWDLFLRILNDYSLKESHAVNQVLSSLSKTEKLEAIGEYISVLKDNSNDKYIAEDKVIELTPVIAAAKKRLQYAPSHCFVSDDSGQIFRLHHYAIELVTFPMTFNHLLLCYHQFRLDGRRDNALIFCNMAFHYLRRNLSFTAEDDYCESIDKLVENFCHVFLSFIDSNQNRIDNLSFDDIQQDTVFIGNASLNAISASVFWNHVSDKIKPAFSASLETSTDSTSQNQYTKEQFDTQFAEEREFAAKVKAQIVARQAIVSLNIVYLFCDALRIMRSNNQEHLYFTNNSLIEKCFSVLKRQTGKLSYNVYTGQADIDKYRLDTGIDARSISECEAREEEIRNISFMDGILYALDEIEEELDTFDIERILQLKSMVRDEIRKCSICTLTDRFSERFISISSRICDRLTDLCQVTFADYETVKQRLLTNLGNESKLLPTSALDALTTAELLYYQYASDDYAEKGFDYSCISALYYQAFEEAYNKLIWCGYANNLNSHRIGGNFFTRILREHKGKDLISPEIAGYLPVDSYNRSFYTNKKHTGVQTSCTYGVFGNLLKKYIVEESEMFVFCDHFAKVFGFSESSVMFDDASFMCKVHEFADAILNAAQRRNEASHGGNLITISQCKNDKQTVLDELETVRADSIGLIQKLLYLMRNSKSMIQN